MITIINCPKCRVEIDSDSIFCDQCGNELKECPKCRHIGKGKRCTQCGTPLISRVQQADPELIKTVRPPAPVAPPASVIPAPSNLILKSTLGMELKVQNGAIVGRRNGPYSWLLATHEYISGTHARLDLNNNGQWTITDMDSTNGTFINNRRLSPMSPQMLNQGDQVTIANLLFTVQLN